MENRQPNDPPIEAIPDTLRIKTWNGAIRPAILCETPANDAGNTVNTSDLGNLVTLILDEHNWRGAKSPSLFDRLDTNKDGFLKKVELTQALKQEHHNSKDSAMVGVLYAFQDDLQKFSDDQCLWDNGITKQDVKGFDERYKRYARAKALCDMASLIDRDNDGMIHLHEFDRMKGEHNLTSEQNEVLDTLRTQALLRFPHPLHITEFTAIRQSMLKGASHVTGGVQLDSLIEKIRSTLENSNRTSNGVMTLYARTPSFRGLTQRELIRGDAVRQGALSNGAFLAPLAAIANRPNLIASMIRENEDHSFTVTFPGDRAHPVVVKAPTKAEMGVFASGGKDGIWPAVLEKAYGAYKQRNWFFKSNTEAEATRSEENPAAVFKLLTGEEPFKWNILQEPNKQQLALSLLNDGLALTLQPSNTGWESTNTPDGLDRNQVFILQKFNAETGIISIRDPRSGKDQQLTTPQFFRNFGTIIQHHIPQIRQPSS